MEGENTFNKKLVVLFIVGMIFTVLLSLVISSLLVNKQNEKIMQEIEGLREIISSDTVSGDLEALESQIASISEKINLLKQQPYNYETEKSIEELDDILVELKNIHDTLLDNQKDLENKLDSLEQKIKNINFNPTFSPLISITVPY